MKLIIMGIFWFLISTAAQAGDAFRVYPYMSIGIGYKIQEPSYVEYEGERLDMNFGGHDTALIEVGLETDYDITFGLKHDSQWSTGFPFNDDPEYYKTEIFVRYKIGGK